MQTEAGNWNTNWDESKTSVIQDGQQDDSWSKMVAKGHL